MGRKRDRERERKIERAIEEGEEGWRGRKIKETIARVDKVPKLLTFTVEGGTFDLITIQS